MLGTAHALLRQRDEMLRRMNNGTLVFTNVKATTGEKFGVFAKLLRSADKETLKKSLAVVAAIYALLFLYVYFSASSTITKLEDRMASETVPLTQGSAHHEVNADQIKTKLKKELSQLEEAGRLPIISAVDNLISFRAYQTPFSLIGIGKKTVLSFMITDYGLSDKTSQIALDILPAEVSFLLSPYAPLPDEWIKRARAKGHEVWMDIPIQNKTYPDNGLSTVYHHTNQNEKKEAMHAVMARALGYVGIGLFMDEGVAPISQHYVNISDEIYGRGLGIFERNPDAPEYIEAKALARAAPFIKADMEVLHMQGKKNSFKSLEALAKKQGHAVATIPPYPEAYKNLATWIEKVGKATYVVAPISAMYDLPIARTEDARNGKAPKGLGALDHVQPDENIHGH